MFFRLLFLLTFVPFIEIYFLIQFSDQFGFSNTLLLVIATGVLGAWMLRRQGASILQEMNQQTQAGHLPSETIAKGFLTFVGGLLLLTPGILTDFVGFSFIFPPTQILWRSYFLSQWKKGVQKGNIHIFTQSRGFGGPKSHPWQESNGSSVEPSGVIDIKASSSETVDKEESD